MFEIKTAQYKGFISLKEGFSLQLMSEKDENIQWFRIK